MASLTVSSRALLFADPTDRNNQSNGEYINVVVVIVTIDAACDGTISTVQHFRHERDVVDG